MIVKHHLDPKCFHFFYCLVFDDGDKRTLRRTQLVIKGERHFKESEVCEYVLILSDFFLNIFLVNLLNGLNRIS